jgi:hypothetical protein
MFRFPPKWLAVPLALAALLLGAAPAFAAHAVKVSPTNMHGWAFVDDNTNGPGTGLMVTGPADPPLGKGSAKLAVTSPADRQVLSTLAYHGTPLMDISKLSYWTYETDPSHAMPFQLDIRYHLTDTGYQGRLVFEPGNGNPIPTGGVWQEWSPLNGRWWASNQVASGGRCTQGAQCTWQEVLTWTGNVDAFTIATRPGHATTYNFEPARAAVEGDGGGDHNGDGNAGDGNNGRDGES